MKNNLFEKNIQSKMGGVEITPSDGLFEKTMQKRAMARQKSILPFYLKSIAVAIIAGVIIFTAWIINDKDSNVQVDLVDSQISPNTELKQELTTVESHLKQHDDKDEHGLNHKSNDVIQSFNSTKISKAINQDFRSEKSNNSIELTKISKTKNPVNIEDNGEDIYKRYFNASSPNKPSIFKETHQGNSHLYVFHSIDESLVDAVFVNYLKVSRFKKLKLQYPLNEFNKVDNNTGFSRNLKTRKPLFIEFLGLGTISKGLPYQGNLASEMKNGSLQTSGFGYGFRVVAPIKDRWSMFSGLNVLNQSAKYQFTTSQSSQEKEVKMVTRYINDPVLGVIPFQTLDTVDVTKVKTQNHLLKNRYSLLQLPIGLSYQTVFKKISIGFNLSTLVNVTTYSQMMYLDDNLLNTNQNKSTSLSLSHAVGIQMGFDLNPKWKVFAEPSIQALNINSKKVGNTVNERFINKQLAFGLRYSLF